MLEGRIWYTTTNKGNNNKNLRQIWSSWTGARCVERSVRKKEKFHWKRDWWCNHASFCTIPNEDIEAMFTWDLYREIECSSNFASSKNGSLKFRDLSMQQMRTTQIGDCKFMSGSCRGMTKGKIFKKQFSGQMKSYLYLMAQLIGIIVCTGLTKTPTLLKTDRQSTRSSSIVWSVFQRINRAVLLLNGLF